LIGVKYLIDFRGKMIDSSDAYKKLKRQIQDSLDYVLLSCHAVPALKGYIKAVEKGSAHKIPNPDYFGTPTDYERLRQIVPSYRRILGRFLILSSFSYFEAYITDVLKEIFDFHGGEEVFSQMAIEKREAGFVMTTSQDVEELAKKLREPPKKGKQEKYAKLNAMLGSMDYMFPTDLFAVYGICELQKHLKEFRSYQIPDILHTALGVRMSDGYVENFHRIRNLRNDIAHGKVSEVNLRKAIEDNKFLRSLAVEIDSHIIKHFFVVES
jgi:hypothetical protein